LKNNSRRKSDFSVVVFFYFKLTLPVSLLTRQVASGSIPKCLIKGNQHCNRHCICTSMYKY